MSGFSDEMILYAGLVVALTAIVAGVVCAVIYTSRKRKLNAKFDAEYGEVQKKK